MESEKILDVVAIDRARAMRIRKPGGNSAVRIGARDPLIAIGFIRPGVSGDVKTG